MEIKPKTIRIVASTLVFSVMGIISEVFLNRFGEHSESYLQLEDALTSQYSQKESTETPSEEKPETTQENPNPPNDNKTQNEAAKPQKQTTAETNESKKTDNNKPQSSTNNNTSNTAPEQTESTPGNTDNQQNSNQSDFTSEVVRLCNNYRQEAGISALLNQNSKLQQAANIRCDEIIQSFSHTRPNGTSAYTVLGEVGVSYTTWGENIAYGQRTPEEVVNGWMNSPGHRANILNANFKEIAVGMKDYYWVQIFI